MKASRVPLPECRTVAVKTCSSVRYNTLITPLSHTITHLQVFRIRLIVYILLEANGSDQHISDVVSVYSSEVKHHKRVHIYLLLSVFTFQTAESAAVWNLDVKAAKLGCLKPLKPSRVSAL